MNIAAKLHFLHRAWRYRLRTEKFGIRYLLSRELEGATVMDIGANRGLFSYWLSRAIGQDGHIIAFEPQEELADHLPAVARIFGIRHFELHRCALSSQQGSMTLTRPRNNWGGASLEEKNGETDTFPVEVKRLDDVMADHPHRPVRFVKCDVEGHEIEVFRGGERFLTEDRPDLLFECHGAADPDCPVFHYLHSIGFRGYCFYRGLTPIERFPEIHDRVHPKARRDFIFLFDTGEIGPVETGEP